LERIVSGNPAVEPIGSGPEIFPPVELQQIPPRERVQDQLHKILASRTFARSKELCRFLQFAVEQKLRNRSVRLKEYLIGVTVFERGESFNPGTDPIVRVQARRLRSKLTLYYETEGCADSVLVELPCGGYVPVFRLRPVLSTAPIPLRAAMETARIDARRSLVVLPFVNMGPEENERLSDGLTEELIYGLSGNSDLRVVARTSAFHFKGKTDDIRSIGERLGVDALVEGSVRSDGNRFRIAAGLIDVRDGGLLWSGVYEQTADDMFAIQKDISERIAKSVAAHLMRPSAAPQPPAPAILAPSA
jgi:serine/threonine-protein kinase